MKSVTVAIAICLSASALVAQDLIVSSRFASKVFRYDAVTGASKGVFAEGSGMANPNGIAIGPDRNLYVGMGDTNLVLRYDGQSGAFIDKFVFDDPATPADESGGLAGCRAIKWGTDGNLYVADGANDRILRFDAKGHFTGIAAQLPARTGPVGLAITADNTLYIGGGLSGVMHVFKDGVQVRACKAAGAATGVAIDANGVAYVATGVNGGIARFAAGSCTALAPFATGLNLPIYMTFDHSGNLLVGDTPDRVLSIDPAGNVSTLVPSRSGGLSGTFDLTFLPAPLVSTTPALVVPGAAKAAGAGGSFFHTSLWMTNPTDTAMVVRLRFLPGAGFTSAGAVDTDPLTIAPHAMRTFNDLLTDAFHVTGNTGGVAIVEVADLGAVPFVTARTFNDTPDGTFGQFIQALPILSTAQGNTWIDGLAGDASSRTNVGIVNFGLSDVTTTLSLFNAAGVKIGNDVTAAAPAHSSIQIGNIQTAAGLGNVPQFSVLAPGDGRYALYASKLDNITSDPIFITPLPARTRQWIDGVGAVAGANGTFFRSSLAIANHGDTPTHIHIAFTSRGQVAPSRNADVTLGSGESRVYNDMLGELFGSGNDAGTILLTSDKPATAWARTYNDRGALGTLGQFIPSIGADDLIGAHGAILQGLTDDANFRTNAGLVNTGSGDANVTVTAWSSDGEQLAGKTYTVAGGQSIFIGGILRDLGIAPRANVYLSLISSVPNVTYAWASYVDNKSTDQTFIRPIAPIESHIHPDPFTP
jgi:hypothetical protein